MKVAIIGASGQLGADAVNAFTADGHAVYALRHEDIEVTDFQSVTRALQPLEPQVIVNTSAMHHVERCEGNPAKAFEVNALGVRNLAFVARDLDAAVMHVSTDYVFDGMISTPYTELHAPRPLNTYGVTKLAGEYFCRHATEKHFVVRTSALYGEHSCRGKGGLNFVELMLKLAREGREVRVVNDETISPTSTEELARQMVVLSRTKAYGLYHATCEGACSWYEFAAEVFSLAGESPRLKIAAPGEFSAKVARPKYSVLENRALKLAGLNVLRLWQEGLQRYLSVACLSGANDIV